jgi:hypothetical protein
MSWDSPSWKRAAVEYHANRPVIRKPDLPANWRGMSGDALWNALNHPSRYGTPEVIIEAIVHSVRARGADALKEPATIDRLSTCDEAAKAQINARLSKLGVRHG